MRRKAHLFILWAANIRRSLRQKGGRLFKILVRHGNIVCDLVFGQRAERGDLLGRRMLFHPAGDALFGKQLLDAARLFCRKGRMHAAVGERMNQAHVRDLLSNRSQSDTQDVAVLY